MIDTKSATLSKVVGILFSVQNSKDSDIPEIERELKTELRRHAITTGCIPDAKGNMPVTIAIEPCGSTKTYEDVDAVPFENVPCPCGDPTHWLIRYERTR